jgi:monoamine oxidase
VESIIVIGGGAAGLIAAKELSAENHVILLEGDNRLGGRMHTIVGDGFNYPVEAGAEFVHGHLPVTLQLLKEAGAEVTEVGGEMVSSRNGKWIERDTMPEGWKDMKVRMKDLQEDITLDEFLQRNYIDEKYNKLCERARGYAQGYDVADPAKVSVFFLRDEWFAGEKEQYRINGGYIKMVDYLAAECRKNGCEIYLNTIVNKVEWDKNKVTAVTADGQQYQANKAIITVPVSILHNNEAKAHIDFVPAIPDYIRAASNIGYGGVIKMVLEFKNAFWDEYKPDTGFVFCNEFIPTWWTQAPDKAPIITGWLGGPRADALVNTSEDDLIQKALQSLATVYGLTLAEITKKLVKGRAFNWPASEFAMGAYSYATPLTTQALEIINAPVEDTIYFAGEALYSGEHPGTVEAALVNGKAVAEKIIVVK